MSILQFNPYAEKPSDDKKRDLMSDFLFRKYQEDVINQDEVVLNAIESQLLLYFEYGQNQGIEPLHELIIGATPALMSDEPVTPDELQAIGVMFLGALKDAYIRQAKFDADFEEGKK